MVDEIQKMSTGFGRQRSREPQMEPRRSMKAKVNVQYAGFEAKPRARQYKFLVQQESGTREFTLSISNEAFNTRIISFQDAPDFCSAKLHRELATFANDPPESQYKISDAELEEYQRARAPRPTSRFHRHTAAKNPVPEHVEG
jgi:hypothetical protein